MRYDLDEIQRFPDVLSLADLCRACHLSHLDARYYLKSGLIEKLYPTLHEADEKKFVDTVNRIIRKKNPPTRLQTQRKISGYTQKELAEKVGVNLRTLQQYEIRAKDINKAAGTTLLALSKVLGCRVEDLLEYDSSEIDDEE